MRLDSHIRHCLYLTWAVRDDELSRPPPPLRYQTIDHDGHSWAFVTALLFRQERSRLKPLPFAPLSFPQLNLRWCVLDDRGMPAVFFERILVPLWALGPVRGLARQPASAARFSYPSAGAAAPWTWEVSGGGTLRCTAEPGSPGLAGPLSLGSWKESVLFVRQRNRGYALAGRRLRSLETEQPTVEVIPARCEVQEADLLDGIVPAASRDRPLHAFLCPEIELRVRLLREPTRVLPQQAAVPG